MIKYRLHRKSPKDGRGLSLSLTITSFSGVFYGRRHVALVRRRRNEVVGLVPFCTCSLKLYHAVLFNDILPNKEIILVGEGDLIEVVAMVEPLVAGPLQDLNYLLSGPYNQQTHQQWKVGRFYLSGRE